MTTSPRSLRTIYTPNSRPQTDPVDPPLDPLTPRNSGSRCRPPPRSLRRSRSRTTSQTFGVSTPDRPQGRPSYHDPLGQLITPSRLTSDFKFTPLFSTDTSSQTQDAQDSTGCNISHPEFTCNTTSYQPKSDPFDPFSNLRGEAKIWSGSFPIRFDAEYPRAVTPQDIMRFTGLASAEESPLFYQPIEYAPAPQYIHPAIVHPAAINSPRSEFATQSSNSELMPSDPNIDLELNGSATLTPELDVYFSFSPLVKDSFGSTPVSAYFQAARISESRDVDVVGEGDLSGLEDIKRDRAMRVDTDLVLSKAEEDTDIKMDDVWGSMSRDLKERSGSGSPTQAQADEMDEGVDQQNTNTLDDPMEAHKALKTVMWTHQSVPLDTPAIKGLVDYPSPTPSPTLSDHPNPVSNVSLNDVPAGCQVRQDSMPSEEIRSSALVEPALEIVQDTKVGSPEEEGDILSSPKLKQMEHVSEYEATVSGGAGSNTSKAMVIKHIVAPGERHPLDPPVEAETSSSQLELSGETSNQNEGVPSPGVARAQQPTSEEELRAMLLQIPDKRYPSRRWPSSASPASFPTERRAGAAFSAPPVAPGRELPRPQIALKRKRKPQPLRLKTPSQNSLTITPAVSPKADNHKVAADPVVEMDQQDTSDAESELTPLPEEESS